MYKGWRGASWLMGIKVLTKSPNTLRANQTSHHPAMMSLVPLAQDYKGIPSNSSQLTPSPPLLSSKSTSTDLFPHDSVSPAPRQIFLIMRGFNLTQSTSSLRTTSEFSSLKRSAKAFKFRKASLSSKSVCLKPPCLHDSSTSNSTPSVSSTARTPTPEFTDGDDVICISREDAFDSSSADEISPDELQTPSSSPYASSYSTTSSSSCNLPPEIEDQPSLGPVDEPLNEYDPRRGSELSVVSSWMDHHLQELDLDYGESGVYEVEIVTTADGFTSRRDSFILPPGESFQAFHRKRTLPVVPAKQFARLSRPLPSTPPPSLGFSHQSRPIRPLPPPPSPW